LSYDDKVALVVAKIEGDVFAELESLGLEFAQQVAARHRLKQDDPANQWIYILVSKYYDNSERFAIRRILADIGPCEGTIRSGLREAVWIAAKNFVHSKFEVSTDDLNGSDPVGTEVRMISV